MANQITDNRIFVSTGAGRNADGETNANDYDDLAGGAAGTWDDEIFIEGSAAIGYISGSTKEGILFDTGNVNDYSDSHFYIWVNCGLVGLLEPVANDGFTVRFAGNTVTDWFEFVVGGNDSWPIAVEGGWVQFVVDIEASATGTNGTPPSTASVRYVGITSETIVMPRHADNTWLDAIWYLQDGNPGIIVEGSATGGAWGFQDIIDQIGLEAGMLKPAPGGAFVLNAPLQVGIDDSVNHWFEDTNKIVLWDDQTYVSTGFYKLSALGSNTALTLGVKTGSGDDATGAQGVVFTAEASSARFDVDFTVSCSAIGIYGCQFQHADSINITVSTNDFVSNTFVDCASARISKATWVRNNVVASPTSTGVAFAHIHDLDNIAFSVFQHSSGHAIEIIPSAVGIGVYTSTQPSTGNDFIGFGASGTNEAAIFNNTASGVVINITDLGDTPSIRNGTGASTNVQNAVNLEVVVQDAAGDPVASAQTAIFQTANDVQLTNQDTNASGIVTDTFNFVSATNIYVRVRKSESGETRYVPVRQSGIIDSGGFATTITLIEDTTVS